jgi:hypothetical protein
LNECRTLTEFCLPHYPGDGGLVPMNIVAKFKIAPIQALKNWQETHP